MVQSKIFLGVSFLCVWSEASSFVCDEDSSCANKLLVCSPFEPCSVSCVTSGNWSTAWSNGCFGTTISCARDAPCSVYCAGNAVCEYLTINASTALNLTLVTEGSDGSSYHMRWGHVICPIAGDCDITCGAFGCIHSYFDASASRYVSFSDSNTTSYAHSTINARQAESLSIETHVYFSYYNASIICPENGPKTSNDLGQTCSITSHTQWWSMHEADIYAVEGYNDLQVSGIGFGHSPIALHCGEYYQISCSLKLDENDLNTVHCDESELNGTICETYLLPVTTNLPTQVTDRSFPTTSTNTLSTTLLFEFSKTSNSSEYLSDDDTDSKTSKNNDGTSEWILYAAAGLSALALIFCVCMCWRHRGWSDTSADKKNKNVTGADRTISDANVTNMAPHTVGMKNNENIMHTILAAASKTVDAKNQVRAGARDEQEAAPQVVKLKKEMEGMQRIETVRQSTDGGSNKRNSEFFNVQIAMASEDIDSESDQKRIEQIMEQSQSQPGLNTYWGNKREKVSNEGVEGVPNIGEDMQIEGEVFRKESSAI